MAGAASNYVAALIGGNDFGALAEAGSLDNLLKEHEKPLLDFVRDFARKHGTFPQAQTVQAHTGIALPTPVEPPSYYLSVLRERHIEHEIKRAVIAVQSKLKADNKDPAGALADLSSAVTNLQVEGQQHMLRDFRQAYDLLVPEYVKQFTDDESGMQFGWPTLDAMTQGLRKGDAASIVGRPAQGKALPVDTLVRMRNGSLKEIGRLEVGEQLWPVGPGDSQVLGVYPQGKREVFSVALSDGRCQRCDPDHLWRLNDGTVLRASELEAGHILAVSVWEGGNAATGPLPPYLMGAVYGSPRPSNTDRPAFRSTVAERILPEEEIVGTLWDATADGRTTLHTMSGYSRVYEDYLDDVRPSHARHSLSMKAPFETWCRADRAALMQGFMVAGGIIHEGTPYFVTDSMFIAYQVRDLAHSLGMSAYYKRNKLDHTVVIETPTIDLFRDGTVPDPAAGPRVISTRYRDWHEDMVCIRVSDPHSCFVLDNWMVTHNTWMMLFGALNAWASGLPTMFVSMEMSQVPVQQRLASMHTHLPMTKIKGGGLDTQDYERFKAELVKLQGQDVPFYVLDGNLAATVEGIWALARHLKLGSIWIDGGYLLKHPTERDRYKRVAENAELIKSELASMCPTVTSWQFARPKNASKKKDAPKEKQDLDDIGYTDAIGQVSSLVLGLMQQESVETSTGREVDILKGRDGQTGQFNINWNFTAMDFSEVKAVELSDLQFD